MKLLNSFDHSWQESERWAGRANGAVEEIKRKEEPTKNLPLLSALASAAGGVLGDGASGADGLAALADVAADVVVTGTLLGGLGGLVLGAAGALEVGCLGLLAGLGVDGAALGQGDLAVVAGALAADLHFGAGELLLNGLVDAGLEGCEEGRVSLDVFCGERKVPSSVDILESEAPLAPREVVSTRSVPCLAPWELRSRSACLAMTMGSVFS